MHVREKVNNKLLISLFQKHRSKLPDCKLPKFLSMDFIFKYNKCTSLVAIFNQHRGPQLNVELIDGLQ